MQQELAGLGASVQIIGVNQAGRESANAVITEGRDLPWLQDTADVDLWSAWNVTYRDVILVDEDGKTVDVFNLTEQDLGSAPVYDDLLQRMRSLDP